MAFWHFCMLWENVFAAGTRNPAEELSRPNGSPPEPKGGGFVWNLYRLAALYCPGRSSAVLIKVRTVNCYSRRVRRLAYILGRLFSRLFLQICLSRCSFEERVVAESVQFPEGDGRG